MIENIRSFLSRKTSQTQKITCEESFTGYRAVVERRAFLKAAGSSLLLGSVGISVQAAAKQSHTAIIVYCDGAMSSIDSFDAKPDAPVEIRGEGKSNRTETGAVFSEFFPQMAKLAGECAIIRSMVATSLEHSSADQDALIHDGKTLGLRLGHLKQGGIPYVHLEHPEADKNGIYRMPHQPQHALESVWNGKTWLSPKLSPLEREKERVGLLKTLGDGVQNTKYDEQRELALQLMSSPPTAFTVKEKDVARYGDNPLGRAIVLSKQLAEEGVARSVSIRTMDWDHHHDIRTRMEKPGRELDFALAALIKDMRRGVWKGVLCVLTEFGRNPKINGGAGRDHHPVHCALFAGEKIQKGIVLGETNNLLQIRPGSPTFTNTDIREILEEAMGGTQHFENPNTVKLLTRS